MRVTERMVDAALLTHDTYPHHHGNWRAAAMRKALEAALASTLTPAPAVSVMPTPSDLTASVPHPQRFYLRRFEDVSGVSGTGVVAEGVQFTDGAAAVRWLGDWPSTCAWASVTAVEKVHGHKGLTRVDWLDPVVSSLAGGR